MKQTEAKRPITHIIWLTLTVFSLAGTPLMSIGELSGIYVSAGREVPEVYGWVLLYYIATAIFGYAGYWALPKNKYLTFVNAIKWRIYSGIMLSIFHWMTVAYITQGWYQVNWGDTVFPYMLFLVFLACVGFIVWLAQKIFPANKTKENEHGGGSPLLNTPSRTSTPDAQEHKKNSIIPQKGWAIIFVVLVCVVCASLVAMFYVYETNNRFYISGSKDSAHYVLDKKTGKTWLVHGKNKIEKKESSKKELKKVGHFEMMLIDGNAGFSKDGISLYATLYNGTSFLIKEITFSVKAINKDKTERWSRIYTEATYLPSKSSATVRVNVLDAADASAEWFISECKGENEEAPSGEAGGHGNLLGLPTRSP